jgi:hypothetical protein
MYIPPVTRLHPLGTSQSASSPSEEFSRGRRGDPGPHSQGSGGGSRSFLRKKRLIGYGTKPDKLLQSLVAPENVMLSEAKNLAFLRS